MEKQLQLSMTKCDVQDYLCGLAKATEVKPIEMDRLDYGQYGDHKNTKPYNTVSEGVRWYLHQKDMWKLPEELIIPMVAHNFGLTVEEAVNRIANDEDEGSNRSGSGSSGVVELS